MDSRPINILRVITWLPVGGIERRLVATLPRLDREKFKVQVACIRERGELADELEAAGVKVHLIPFKRRWDRGALKKLAALMRDEKIDVVHSHMYRSNVPATVAAHMAGVGRVWGQVHNVGTWETRRQAWMDLYLSRWRTGMIAVSERVKQDVMEKLRLPKDRVKVIYNGVDLKRFQQARQRREEVRAAENVNEENLVFIFAARLVEQKRGADFIEAFGRLQRMDGGEKLRAWVLGDGPQRYQLESQAAALRLPNAMKFFGQRDDVERFLGATDVFVLPSTKEGFSNALVEAMAAGLCCIATDVGGNAEAIRDQTDGLIVPPQKVDALTQAMHIAWSDSKKRMALAASAAKRAQLFSIENMIAAIEELYSK